MLIIISSSISSSLLYYLSLMTLRPLLPVVIASVIVLLQTANISLRHAGRSATMFLHEWSTPHPSTCLQGVSKSQERTTDSSRDICQFSIQESLRESVPDEHDLNVCGGSTIQNSIIQEGINIVATTI